MVATAQQLVHVGTGEDVNEWIGHTYGIIERYIPTQVDSMRAANQQRWRLSPGFSLQHAADALAITPRTLQRRTEAVLGKSPLAYFRTCVSNTRKG